MTRTRMTPLLASFLGATVIAPAAFAQTAEELAAQGQACEALRTLHIEQADILRESLPDQGAGRLREQHLPAVARRAQAGQSGAATRASSGLNPIQ